MRACEVCGNEYDNPFEIRVNGVSHVFDSVECAIHALVPACARCGCRVQKGGIPAGRSVYCSVRCAERDGSLAVEARA